MYNSLLGGCEFENPEIYIGGVIPNESPLVFIFNGTQPILLFSNDFFIEEFVLKGNVELVLTGETIVINNTFTMHATDKLTLQGSTLTIQANAHFAINDLLIVQGVLYYNHFISIRFVIYITI